MAIIKLQFRALDQSRICDRNLVFREIMTKLKVPLLGLKTIQTGYNALIERKEDAETILTQKGIDLLKTMNLTVRVPPELRAKRSVFIRQVDQTVGSHSELEIETELEKNHEYLTGCKVIKIKDFTHIFKLECATVTQADKVLETLMFLHSNFPPSNKT